MADLRATAARNDVREFVTPEGVDLGLRLGSVGERAGAFVLDLLIIVGLLFVFTFVTIFLFIGVASGGGQAALQTLAATWLLGFFVLRNFYFTAFELGTRSATIGKRVMKLRVVARDGRRLSGHAVVARNAMRELEFFLPLSFLAYETSQGLAGFAMSAAGLLWSGGFLLFPLFNRDHMRVGDLIAGTWVVRLPRRRLGASVLGVDAPDRYSFTDQQLAAYGEFELQKLEDVLRRQDELAMIVVARTIRARIGWAGDESDELAFLRAYYAALCTRLERGMLFGKRRRDKHDAT
ncbi:RDD family protein [Sphingomonas psychrotolerans]|uniref:RDD family protein n=1 Tax=Sphingomonas psychrotolerans TaxID=1327635 RepID=A0A2K8M9V0_9SPHN|nr:RDD family protein [Sphingomonas psychrotolerans]ATY30662.1 RDD family protein [Sphingomonas psychrotolerans]